MLHTLMICCVILNEKCLAAGVRCDIFQSEKLVGMQYVKSLFTISLNSELLVFGSRYLYFVFVCV